MRSAAKGRDARLLNIVHIIQTPEKMKKKMMKKSSKLAMDKLAKL